jgi:hypothetical protein
MKTIITTIITVLIALLAIRLLLPKTFQAGKSRAAKSKDKAKDLAAQGKAKIIAIRDDIDNTIASKLA